MSQDIVPATNPRCTICASSQREKINAALVRLPLREVAREFGVAIGTLHRHQAHLNGALQNARLAGEIEDIGTLYARMKQRSADLWSAAEGLLESRPELFPQFARVAQKFDEMLAKFAQSPGFRDQLSPTTINAPDARIVVTKD